MPPLRQAGLTLLELIVVMAIIAVVMAMVGLPFLSQQRSLKAWGHHARALIQVARTIAITHGVTEQLQIDPRTRTLRLTGSSPTPNPPTRALHVPRSVRVTVAAGVPRGPHGIRRFLFYADGSATPGSLIFHRRGREVKVTVGLFSHAR